MTSVFIETLGCKLNQAESETISRDLAAEGYRIVSSVDQAGVLLLNTCTVTHIADRKARQAVRAAVKANRDLKVVITGCYAERDKNELDKLPGVVAVWGNQAKNCIAAKFLELGLSRSHEHWPVETSRNRSMIKIQDGCDLRCAYCIVPLVRPVKSCVPADHIVEQINKRQGEGIREVVLTGTEIGEYSCDGMDLAGLLRRILDETSVERIRISSLQPQEVTQKLIGLWENKRLCRHFHLSLQNGSDAVVRRMRRRYNTADYRNAVALIGDQAPGGAITTDIIAGFPGETDVEFEESIALIETIGFARLHVFPYSPRPGTTASSMPDQIDPEIVKGRVERLIKLGRRCETDFRRKFKGQSLDVLFEGQDGDKWLGYSDNYIRIAIESDENLENQIVAVKL